jgi:hypothetical protein
MTTCPVCKQELPSGLALTLSGRYAKQTIVCPHCGTTLKLSGRTKNLLSLVFLVGLGLTFLFWYVEQITGNVIYAGIAFACLIAACVISVVLRVRSTGLEPVMSAGEQK